MLKNLVSIAQQNPIAFSMYLIALLSGGAVFSQITEQANLYTDKKTVELRCEIMILRREFASSQLFVYREKEAEEPNRERRRLIDGLSQTIQTLDTRLGFCLKD